MGNAFLSHIRAVDGLFHVIRAFDEADVTHVEGDVNPIRDLEIIHQELRLKDLEFIQKNVVSLQTAVTRAGVKVDKNLVIELETAKKCLEMLEKKRDVRLGDWNNKEVLQSVRQPLSKVIG